jgi:hypothetical protein
LTRILRLVLFPALLAVAAACAQTSIVATWKEPGAGPVRFNRVLVMAPSADSALRRTIEDELARRLRTGQATPSYTIFSDEELKDREAVQARAAQMGFDGVVVFRVVSVDRQATWVPGTYWGPYYAFGGWPVYDPGYVRTDTVVRVDTDVYSARDRRLIWASTSKTYDPSSVRKLVDEVTTAVTKQMRKQGLIT